MQQVNVFCVNHPTQRAFAEYLKKPRHYLDLGAFYQEKRDRFLQLISGSRFMRTAATAISAKDLLNISTVPC